MVFSLISPKRKSPSPSPPKRTQAATEMLASYSEYSNSPLTSSFERRRSGERGIVVLSAGEDPIFAETEQYYTDELFADDDNLIENTRGLHPVYDLRDAGRSVPTKMERLADTARGYQLEQEMLRKWNTNESNVDFEVLWDASDDWDEVQMDGTTVVRGGEA